MKIVRHPNIVSLQEVCFNSLKYSTNWYNDFPLILFHIFLALMTLPFLFFHIPFKFQGFGQPDKDIYNSRVCNWRRAI